MTLDQMIERLRASIAERMTARAQHVATIASVRESLSEDGTGLSEADEKRAADAAAARDAVDAEVEHLRVRLEELEAEKRSDEAAARLARSITPVDAPVARAHVGAEPNPVYRKGDSSTSYFRDLFGAVRGDRSAQDRLSQSQERAATSSSATNGGVFAPPAWLISDWVDIARAGRVTADLMNRRDLPDGIASINIPKLTGGSGVGVTVTQNTTITETAITTTSVSSGITTISGKQTVSIELLRQSATPIDDVILADLAASYAVKLDTQVLNGANASGELRGLVTAGTTVTFTATTAAVVSSTVANSFYHKVLGAKNAVESSRLMPTTAIIMHPRRWNWVLSGIDTTMRPLVTPADVPTLNGIGQAGNGFTGHSLAGLPVYVDANISTAEGSATNQDQVFVLRTDDLWLWESAPELASFEATLAAQNSVLFRVLGFAAFIPHRYNYAVAYIDGTGLTTPSF